MLFLAGLVSSDTVWQASLLAATYLIIHLVEEALTPIMLARRFTLNPVPVIISIVFWNWMSGVGGALLAVPLLAALKISAIAFDHWQHSDISAVPRPTTERVLQWPGTASR